MRLKFGMGLTFFQTEFAPMRAPAYLCGYKYVPPPAVRDDLISEAMYFPWGRALVSGTAVRDS